MSYADTKSLKSDLVVVAKILAVIGAITLLHYFPVLQQKYIAGNLIEKQLMLKYPSYPNVNVIRSADRSNYQGLFNPSGLAPTGGNEEYWDFCLLVSAESSNGKRQIEAFRAVGDRAYQEMNLRKVSSYRQCRSDQAG